MLQRWLNVLIELVCAAFITHIVCTALLPFPVILSTTCYDVNIMIDMTDSALVPKFGSKGIHSTQVELYICTIFA